MSVKLRKKITSGGKVTLILDIYSSGVRRKEALGIYLNGDRFQNREAMKLAEVIRAKREIEIQAQMNGIANTQNRKGRVVKYVESLIEVKRTASTRSSWRNALNHLQRYGGENLVFLHLDRTFFEGFKEYLLSRLSTNSAKRNLDVIKTMIHRAMDDNILPHDPSAKVKIKKESTLPVFLTLQEVRKLHRTPCGNENVKAAFLFSCLTGLRYSDVDGLTWDKVRDGCLEFTQQKTRASERLPLSKQAMEILRAQRNAEKGEKVGRMHPVGSVFMFPRKSTVDKVIRHWVRDAGINKPISFHKSRHTFATLSLSSGIDIYTTSKLLGHKNLQTTQIYANVIDERKVQAVSMLPMI